MGSLKWRADTTTVPQAMKNWLIGFGLGFLGTVAYKTARSNAKEATALANVDFAERQQMLATIDQNKLYQDWLKYGPRWQNGYYVPMD